MNRNGALAKWLVAVLAVALLLFELFPAWATNSRVFAVGGRTFGTTNGWAVVPAVGGKVAVVKLLSVSTDQSPGRIVVYSNGPPAVTLYDHAITVSNIQVSATGTNGLAAGDVLLAHIGNTPTDKYERLRVVSVSTTNILIAVTSSVPMTAGTRLYRLGTNQVITGVTNGATSLHNAAFITASEIGQPLLIDIIGTSSLGIINAVGGEYIDAPNP